MQQFLLLIEARTDGDIVYQDGIKAQSKKKLILHFEGLSADIDEFELERRGSTSTLNSATSAGSLKRRFSWTQSSSLLEKIDIHFASQEGK